MGGTVAVTIRKKDGTIYKMARKTGSYTGMFFSEDFANGDFDKAIDSYIKIFTEMKEDYEKGEPYKFAMSPFYGWCNELAPFDYGLVVIDFKDNVIYSMQEYDLPGTTYLGDLFIKSERYFSGNLIVHDFNSGETSRLYKILNCDPNDTGDDLFKKVSTNDELMKRSSIYSLYDEKLENFTLKNYDNDLDSLVKFFNDLKIAGFIFNDKEISLWLDYSKDLMIAALESTDGDDEYNELEIELTKLLINFY